MTRRLRVVTVNGAPRTISPDDPRRDGDLHWAVIEGRMIDELTGQPVQAAAAVTPIGTGFASPAARGSLSPRTAPGGLFALAGVPRRVLPRLDAQAYEVGVEVKANGYVRHRASQLHGPIASFPTTYTAADVGDLSLHREPVEICGRVMRRLATGVIEPAPGATVTVTALWRTLPTPTGPAGPTLARVRAIHPPLYAPRPAATSRVSSVELSTALTPLRPKTLVAHAAPGETRLRLSDRRDIAVSNILRIDDSDPSRTEYHMIAAIENTVDPADAATVTLEFPLALEHRRGVDVRQAVVLSGGPDRLFFADGIPGDAVLLLAPAGGLNTPTLVEIHQGTPVREYHQLLPFTATATNPDADYRLPPISRVAQVTLQAVSGVSGPPRTLSLDYTAREQRVDFLFV